MGYSTLKAALDAVVRTNGNQQITGANLNGVMTTILQGVDILNRENPADTSGMNYVVLDKNGTFSGQVTGANTIYEIRDNFTLSADKEIPTGCILLFNGGKISGGGHTLTFNQNIISGNARFENCEFSGEILNGEVKISWFTNGMSSSTDYSVDHSQFLISAMKLASCKKRGWLDLEKIPLCIKQTIVITDVFGNIGMRGANITFVSSSAKQALFDYQETASYRGNYSPIIDSEFVDVGDNYNTCVIKKTSWSDTVFTYWRDIRASGFTGHFFVTNSYVQEVTFENITLSGFGMFSTNSDSFYDGGVGSGNIINFLNCNINGGSSTSKTNILSLYDFSRCIEVTIHNAVCQGRIGGSDIYAVNINNTGNTTGNRTTIEFDGFWIEYVDGHVNGKCKIYNSSCLIITKRNSVSRFKIESSNVTIDFGLAGGAYTTDLWDWFDIDTTSNVTLNIDAATYGTSLLNAATYPKFKALLDAGRLRVVKNSTPPYGAGQTQTGVSISLYPVESLDLKRKYIETKITSPNVTSKPFRHFLSDENGIPILNISHPNGTTQYYEFTFLNHIENMFHGGVETQAARSFYNEIIYRASVLVDVTSENINEVKCTGRGFMNQGGGGYVDFITPSVGMHAGDNTGWVRTAFCSIWAESGLSSGLYMALRNCKLEIAVLRMCRRNVVLDDEIYIDGSGNLVKLNPKPEIFSIPVAAASDNVDSMSAIIGTSTAIVMTPKNMYKQAGGVTQGLLLPASGSTMIRPLPGGLTGFLYFDTTMGKMVVSNGSAWINLDGTPLT